MLAQIAARWQLGLILGEELPGLAAQLLLAGYDNQPLRELAGEPTATLRDEGPRFATALTLCRAPVLEDVEAARLLGQWVAEQIHSGAPPYQAARRAGDLWYRFPENEVLGTFYSLTDSWEESPEHREAIEQEMREYAAQVTAPAKPHAS